MSKTKDNNGLTDIEKQMLTIHRRIVELIHKDHLWHNLTWREVKIIQRMSRKFLRTINGTKYDTDMDSYGDTMSHVLKVNLTSREDSPAVYLTWVSFGYHHLIRRYCPSFIKNGESVDKFYKKTLEMLCN